MAVLPDICPSSVKEQTTPRVLRAQFGDGYTQRAIDGLNNLPRTLNVTWANFSDTDIQTLVDFFEARAGVEAFDWMQPKDTSTRQYIASVWNRTATAPAFEVSTLTATFEEVFDLP